MTTLNAREIALHAARIAWEKDGQELRVLEFPPGGTLFDYCVLVNGRSDRQVKSIVDELWHFAKRQGLPRLPVEGESGWMVIDLLDVVVHAFGPEQRVHYALDTLWPQARTVDHESEFRRLPKLDYVRRPPAPAHV
jgi:ribosome-associated protein